MTGQKIYENFTDGIGSEGLSDSAAMVNELAAEYHDEGEAIRRLTAKLESVWQGEAAGSAQRGAGPLATEHELAAPHMATAQDLNSRQAGSFGDARNAVVPVPPEPTAPDPWAAFTSPGAVVTYRQQVADYNAANQHNVDVMTGYTNASTYNTKGMPQSYGSLTDDQAGIAVDTATSNTGGRRDGGPTSDDSSPRGERGVVEWPTRGSGWVAPPPDTSDGPPSPGAPSDGRPPVPQQTTPGGFTETPTRPAPPVPVGAGGGFGSGPPSGGSGGGLAPGTGFVPVGGGLGDSSGGRGPSSGPGGRGAGGPGSGSGAEVRGPGSRGGGGEPHGPGGRPGAAPPPGSALGDPHGTGRSGVAGAAGRGAGLGGMPMAAGGRGRGEEDLERRLPSYLQEDDPEAVFGTEVLTAPPVIGEDLDPLESDEQPSTG